MVSQVHTLQHEKGQVENEAQHLLTKYQENANEAWLSYDQLSAKSKSDSTTITELKDKNQKLMKNIDEKRRENADLLEKNRAVTTENEKLLIELKAIQDEILAKTLAVSCSSYCCYGVY